MNTSMFHFDDDKKKDEAGESTFDLAKEGFKMGREDAKEANHERDKKRHQDEDKGNS